MSDEKELEFEVGEEERDWMDQLLEWRRNMSCTMSCFGKLIVCLNPNASKGKEYIRWVIFITKEFTNTIRVVIVRYWDRKY
ncbi:hypothetical protein L3Y34_012606 [Caenorhabditis briggsae]|uniref:Uncharacterized protein n=2 Tax=Caenorhabditis briggsae TaxID=6238 RepID=A0AAE9CW28_CAEBR|nr:hypothetical protein L3Y34_012606 [Caenorhabditis briggsae]